MDDGGDGEPNDPQFVLTAHARAALTERGIDPEWVERVLGRPAWTEPDRDDPSLRHAIGPIAERDDRMLRVVYNATMKPWSVVTFFFDRRLRHML